MLTIGEVAAHARVNASAIRYYERAGLLPAARRKSKRRVYDDDVFELLALIQLAQHAGFTVAETRTLLHGFERGTPPSQRWRVMAVRKMKEIEARIERAERMRDVLERLLRCRCETLGQCVRSRKEAMSLAAQQGS